MNGLTESTSALADWTDRITAIGYLAAWFAFTCCALWALKNLSIHTTSNEQGNDNDH